MKKSKLRSVLLLLLLPFTGLGQVVFQDPFNYTPSTTSDLVAQAGTTWLINGTAKDAAYVTGGNLTYPGITSSGNKIAITGTTSRYYRTFPALNGSRVYASFIFQVTALPDANALVEGDYFVSFGNSGGAGTNFCVVYLRKSPTNATKFNIGLRKRGIVTETGAKIWLDEELELNTPYYLVMGTQMVGAGAAANEANDIVKLWLNPDPNSAAEPMPSLQLTEGQDLNTYDAMRWFILNNDSKNTGLKMEIDELNVRKTWTGQAPLVPTTVDVGTYYIDATGGDDSADGLSAATAWKTLTKVNASIFQPGSKILFKAGESWVGQLAPLGSGASGNPIIIDKYGVGSKPLFNGNGLIADGVVKLYNQSFWEINNLEIVNDAASNAERRGVEINAANFGLVKHIYLKNLEVHHIRGTVGGTLPDKRSAGIYFTVSNDDAVATRFDDILVEGCLIYNCQNQGIVTNNEISASNYPGSANWEKRKFTNLVVRNNVIHHISKNAMIIRLADGGLVERNLCYETAIGTTGNTIFSRSSRNTVFQYNEGYLNRALENGDFDGSLYDPDLQSPGTIWQYSYSHDNSDGLIVFCTNKDDDGIIVRYNISQNDKGDLVKINFPFVSAQIYNNTFYIGSGLKPTVIKEVEEDHTYTFQNNIVYNADANLATNPKFVTANSKQNRTISDNIFYRVGNVPAYISSSSNYYTFDPLFVNPGNGQVGLLTVGGYQLKPGSQALAKGILVSNNGGQDYFGNPVSATEKPNIGFYNGPGTNSDILPIELLTATAKISKDGNGVDILWATASEKDNAWFIIERSADGINFEQIAKIAGSGNTSSPVYYNHKDSNPNNGVNYYWIKQIDFNGTSSYAGRLLSVNFGNIQRSEFQVYPNPVKDKLFVNMKGRGTEDIGVAVYNMVGEQLIDFKVSGTQPIKVDMNTLKQGVYLLRLKEVKTGKMLFVSKIIKTD